METTFQTQTQSTCTSISQEEGFLMGARRFRLAAVVTILVLMPLFINQINHLLYMVSYDSNVQKITSAENLRSRASDEIVPFREFIIKDDTSALL